MTDAIIKAKTCLKILITLLLSEEIRQILELGRESREHLLNRNIKINVLMKA